jgi:hypothetical protein
MLELQEHSPDHVRPRHLSWTLVPQSTARYTYTQHNYLFKHINQSFGSRIQIRIDLALVDPTRIYILNGDPDPVPHFGYNGTF